MSRPAYIVHIDLLSGKARRAWRRDVQDQTITLLTPLLHQALDNAATLGEAEFGPTPLEGEPTPLPDTGGAWFDGYGITAATGGKSLLTLLHGPAGPFLTSGLCIHSRASKKLWAGMHAAPGDFGGPLATDPDDPPATPWLATRLIAPPPPDTWDWYGEAIDCLAWTFLEMRRGQH